MTKNADLETRILIRLQERKHGQTVAELSKYCGVANAYILTALFELEKRDCVLQSGDVWTLRREPKPPEAKPII